MLYNDDEEDCIKCKGRSNLYELERAAIMCV